MITHRIYSFGDFVLDLRRGALLKAGVDVKLRPKSFEVLRVLVERHGQLVSKDALLDAVWGRTVVTEGAVTQCLIDVRRVLGDEAQQWVRTVPRRGYIFDGPVVPVEDTLDAPVPPPSHGSGPADVPASRVAERHRYRSAGWVLAGALILVGAATLLLRAWERGPERPAGPAAANSIAVLPFVDMSEAHDQQYLSDGITEEILDRLAQSSQLRVIARTSSFLFRDQPVDVPLISERLGVSHVLEGSVRRIGDRVRVTAQLVDTATNSHVWSHTYDRSLGDLFAVQDEIAGQVVSALQARLVPARSAAPPANPLAYERFLQGRYFFGRGGAGDMERAIKYYEEAVALDPGYARAWAELSGVYDAMSGTSIDADDWLDRQHRAAQRAVDLAPDSVDARVRLGRYYFNVGEMRQARDQFRIAAALDPGQRWLDDVASGRVSWDEQQLDGILADQRLAAARDPLSAMAHKNLGLVLFRTGHLDEALAEFRRALELNPDLGWDVQLEIGRVLVVQRRFDAADREILRLPQGQPRDFGLALLCDAPGMRKQAEAALARLAATEGDYMHDVRIAELHVLRGAHDQAFAWLQRARDGLKPDRTLNARIWMLQSEMFVSPFLAPLDSDPRWAALMTTKAWEASGVAAGTREVAGGDKAGAVVGAE